MIKYNEKEELWRFKRKMKSRKSGYLLLWKKNVKMTSALATVPKEGVKCFAKKVYTQKYKKENLGKKYEYRFSFEIFMEK